MRWLVVALLACKRDAPHVETRAAPTNPSAPPPWPVVFMQKHGVEIEPGLRETEPMLSRDDAARPVTFILHALCSDEIWMCDWLQYGHLAPQWQLCPRGQLTCGPGQYKWGGDDTAKLLQHAFERARERHGARIDDHKTVLVGMSQGAYTIAALLRHPLPFKVRGVVLHGARVQLRAEDLKGIRLVLAAGDLDGAAPEMKRLAARLSQQGVTARYASFGHVGHFLPVGSATIMSELIEWARAQ